MSAGPEPAFARPAGVEDATGLAELYRLAHAELAQLRGGRVMLALQQRAEPVEATFLEELGAGSDRRLVVGCLGGTVVGYGTCRPRPLTGGELLGSIDELFVVPQERRKGVGSAMLASLLSWSRERGCTSVDAAALPGSRPVKSFFESQGLTARLLLMHRALDVAP